MIFVLIGVVFIVLIIVLIIRTLKFTRHYGKSRDDIPDEININEAADRLSKAIRFETISTQSVEDFNQDAFNDMHIFLAAEFPLLHEHLRKKVINQYSLLYIWPGTNPALDAIMLTSHIDVVPVEPGTENNWKYPPFEGKISEGYIWGRGAMDVLGGVLAIMEAVEYLIKTGFEPERTVILGFGHDEEVDGDKGAFAIGHYLQQQNIRLNYLLDEGTPIVHEMLPELPNPVALIAVAEKGYLSLELSTTGEGGHSSVPQGLTSIAVLAEAIHKLENNPLKGKIDSLVKKTMESIGPHMPFIYRVVMANLWLFQNLVKRELSKMPATQAALYTTIATTIFESGIKENVLPTKARAIVNFRIHPNDTIESIKKFVVKTINNPEIKITELHGSINPSSISDVNDSAYRTLRDTIKQVFPEVIVAPTLMVGATDARHYAGLTDNIYRFIPLRAVESDLDRVHGTNERISKENYREMIYFYSQLIKNSAIQ